MAGLFAASGIGYCVYASLPHPKGVTAQVSVPALSSLSDSGLVVQPLEVNFSDSAAKLADIGKTIVTGASIEPSVPGKWVWTSDRRLIFAPDSGFDWPAGRTYKIAFDRALFPSYLRLESYHLPFTTRPFTAEIEGHFYV
ncbi:MAG TPA: hypothetical protein VIM58_01100, partial [Candidatus Methylacidiphilales bacterium]